MTATTHSIPIRLKDLESRLQLLKGFHSPKVELEQYVTSPHLASRILFTAQNSYQDLNSKSVLDLGCGSGVLTIGSSLCGSTYTLGIDIDSDALQIAQTNLQDLNLHPQEPIIIHPIDFLRLDLSDHDLVKLFKSNQDSDLVFDTVIMNPPFGTKTKGIDMVFLEIACQMSKSAVYSLHKTSTRKFIMKKAKQLGFEGEVLAEMKYDLPKTLKMHKHKTVDIAVDFWRFEKIKGPS